jgi:hypothetical protein
MNLNEICYDDVDRIHVAQGRDHWRTLMQTAMKLGVP